MYTGTCGRRTSGTRSCLPGDPRWEGSEPSDFDWRRAAREIVEEMDGASVDMSVIILADFAMRFGETEVGVEEENAMLVSAHEMYPDRLIAFYGIDPHRGRGRRRSLRRR